MIGKLHVAIFIADGAVQIGLKKQSKVEFRVVSHSGIEQRAGGDLNVAVATTCDYVEVFCNILEGT